jgi:O-6-methylguanine DNA methyltransferase
MFGKYASPLGIMTFEVEKDHLIGMTIDDLDVVISDHPMILKIQHELDQYFKGQLKHFGLAVSFHKGTPFQQSVWREMLKIPYGQTKSYGEIAALIGKPLAVRAVGQACKKNPIGIVVPCHRVIGKDGSMTGYSGKDYIHVKQRLLDFEREHKPWSIM